MPAEDFTLALFCRIDDELRDVPKPKLAHLYPSEVVTVGVLQVLRGEGWRPFYRWNERMLIETLFSICEGVLNMKKMDYRLKQSLLARLQYTAAAHNLCLNWTGSIQFNLAHFKL